MNLQDFIQTRKPMVEAWLDELVRGQPGDPEELWRAMRYAVLGGGKRMRPLLMLAVGETFGAPPERFSYAAAALECVHTYSLVHDDLPCMDDDALRRGRPTCHVRFGEAQAVLAGDALLTLAFELLGRCPYLSEKPGVGLRVVSILARRAGASGMVGGQTLDMAAEGAPVTETLVQAIHRRKTAALIQAAVEVGALMCGVSDEVLETLSAFGLELGLAFQIRDDIMDVTLPSEQLGKTAGKDDVQRKATYPRAVGLEAAEAALRSRVRRAAEVVRDLDVMGLLAGFARYAAERRT